MRMVQDASGPVAGLWVQSSPAYSQVPVTSPALAAWGAAFASGAGGTEPFAVAVATAHLIGGALILATTVVVALRCGRLHVSTAVVSSRHALSDVEGPVLSDVEGPALSDVEGPAPSDVEGSRASASSRLAAIGTRA